MRRRFFVDEFDGRAAKLRGEAAHHLGRVLRAEAGQVYELSDGKEVWLGRIDRVSRDAVEFGLLERLPASAPALQVTLLLSIVKFDRFEWALEKATELGVGEIVPLAAARSDKSLLAAAQRRAARWQRILLESAQQSRRLRPPALLMTQRPHDAFNTIGAQRPSTLLLAASLRASGTNTVPGEGLGVKVLLSERPEAPALREVLEGKRAAAAGLAIGPEGGWTDEELAAARTAGWTEASLGANILRTETAVIAALVCLNYALGE